jgi:hypothetical protein
MDAGLIPLVASSRGPQARFLQSAALCSMVHASSGVGLRASHGSGQQGRMSDRARMSLLAQAAGHVYQHAEAVAVPAGSCHCYKYNMFSLLPVDSLDCHVVLGFGAATNAKTRHAAFDVLASSCTQTLLLLARCLCRQLGMAADVPAILLVGGGEGMGQLEATVEELNKHLHKRAQVGGVTC